jgi:hypothetical protein
MVGDRGHAQQRLTEVHKVKARPTLRDTKTKSSIFNEEDGNGRESQTERRARGLRGIVIL